MISKRTSEWGKGEVGHAVSPIPLRLHGIFCVSDFVCRLLSKKEHESIEAAMTSTLNSTASCSLLPFLARRRRCKANPSNPYINWWPAPKVSEAQLINEGSVQPSLF